MRTSSHVIETRSRDYFQQKINNSFENGDALFRNLSERDYGIDGLVELFDNGHPTGKIAFIQIKGKEKLIAPQIRNPVVSCPNVSSTNFAYAYQTRIPVILVYVSLESPNPIYYVELQTVISQFSNSISDSVSVKIPQENLLIDNMQPLFDIIHKYYANA